jgi:transposase
VRAAFPKGHLYVDVRAEFGALSTAQLFAALYPPQGRPVEVAPWRLALVVVMPESEGLTDRQAADAVRRCMDWQDALSLALHDPGFAFTLLHDCRPRLLAHDAAQRLLETFLTTCKARGWITARGPQRTDATHVLAAIRTLNRLACVLEAMQAALNQLRQAAPTWVQQGVTREWYDRYGLRSDPVRLPKEASKREALARQVGVDGDQLLDAGWAAPSPPDRRTLPAVEALRQMWVQPYDRCSVPGMAEVRWRPTEAHPPAAVRLTSPDELEARSCTKRDTQWGGYKHHLTATCEPEHPGLLTQGLTTPATTPDCPRGPPIVQDLAARDLLPGTHLFDSGDVAADFLVTAQQHQSDVVGPPLGS